MGQGILTPTLLVDLVLHDADLNSIRVRDGGIFALCLKSMDRKAIPC